MHIFGWFLLLISPLVCGEVYKCVRDDQSIIYKDTPCKPQDLRAIYVYPFDSGALYAPDRKQLLKQHKQRAKLRLREQKKLAQEQNRRLRLQTKCGKVVHQIELLNQRYRSGYTARQRQTLDRKLAEYKQKRKQYCK